MRVFEVVLVADRGDVAARLLRACGSLGVKAVGVHSDADRDAPHVDAADESVPLGADDGGDPYGDVTRIVEAAQQSRAEAVHPGAGPLAADPEAAAAVRAAGLAWVDAHPPYAEGDALRDDLRRRLSA